MGKIGRGLLRFLQSLIMIYFFGSLTFATPYYNWQYAKDNGFIKWAFGGEIIATAKAFVWPYFVLTDYMNQEVPSRQVSMNEATEGSLTSFFAAISSVSGAQSLMENMLISDDPLSDWDDMQLLLRNAQTRLTEVDTTVLNNIYNGWGEIVDSALIPAVKSLVAGIENDFEEIHFARADAMMVRYNNWLNENSQSLLFELHDSFGYEIR